MDQPCPSFNPSLSEVLSAPIVTTRHIPSIFRLDFSDILGNLLFSIATKPTWEVLYRLFVLPKLVLRASGRGGKLHHKQQAPEMARRLELFRQDQLERLWIEASTSRVPKRSTQTRSMTRLQEDGGMSVQ